MPNTSQSTQSLSNPIASIHQFFNGDSIEKIRSDMDNLQTTTITESYGDLDKEDKWLLIDFLRRISNLIEVAHVLITKPDNPEIAPN
ncbi:hypothetical protein [Pseudoflavitalea rhizosphaerae]|uniref:hypothetical protein n=1 Tax=Pseudoflavitalea rhizosphaerae TaxID=1884793 RepID=UPI000F8EBE8B|nr:hypothetical protein [Pseudoflavitalea rhizosphaerae]